MKKAKAQNTTAGPFHSHESSQTEMPEGGSSLAIAWWPIEQITPYQQNPRLIPPVAIEKVAASIKEFGFRQPIVVDADGVIIVGHVRLLAAKHLGLAFVPVHRTDLSPQQAAAYRLADNRSAEESSWDMELLPAEIAKLAESGYDLSSLGFDPAELAGLLAMTTGGLIDPDEVPEPPAEPISRPGTHWQLGSHRLSCADSTELRRCDA